MKDAALVRPTVSAWLEEQWTSRHLQPELLLERLLAYQVPKVDKWLGRKES
jgi:hypothetical protein